MSVIEFLKKKKRTRNHPAVLVKQKNHLGSISGLLIGVSRPSTSKVIIYIIGYMPAMLVIAFFS